MLGGGGRGVNRRGQFVAPCARSQFSVQNRHISLAPCGRPGRRLTTSLLFWLVFSGPPERFIQSTAHTINAPRPQGPLRTHTNTQTHLVDATNAAPHEKIVSPTCPLARTLHQLRLFFRSPLRLEMCSLYCCVSFQIQGCFRGSTLTLSAFQNVESLRYNNLDQWRH
jgi:hypothetical protein